MAKKVVATLKKADGKVLTKAIKMVKSPKNGAYVFKERMLTPEEAKEFFAKK